MILAIVGSTSLAGRVDVYQKIQSVIEDERPDSLVSGGAPGVDTMMAEVAAMLGLPYEEYFPATQRWADGFAPRNVRVAERCDKLVRIAIENTKTYGSGWTRDRAQEFGKPWDEYVFGVIEGTGLADGKGWSPAPKKVGV